MPQRLEVDWRQQKEMPVRRKLERNCPLLQRSSSEAWFQNRHFYRRRIFSGGLRDAAADPERTSVCGDDHLRVAGQLLLLGRLPSHRAPQRDLFGSRRVGAGYTSLLRCVYVSSGHPLNVFLCIRGSLDLATLRELRTESKESHAGMAALGIVLGSVLLLVVFRFSRTTKSVSISEKVGCC